MTAAGPKKKAVIAVLTGDLVRSSYLSAADLARARDTVEAAGEEIGQWAPKAGVGGVEFFRGDAWQLALGDAGLFLRTAVFVRAKLKSENIQFDTRIGIGLGSYDELDPKRVSLSTGEAFTISGRTLDGLMAGNGIAVGVPDRANRRLGWVGPFTALCSTLVDRWTERQADIVCRVLVGEDLPQRELAHKLQVSQQLVSKQLGAADFSSLMKAIEYVEAFDWRSEVSRKEVRFVAI